MGMLPLNEIGVSSRPVADQQQQQQRGERVVQAQPMLGLGGVAAGAAGIGAGARAAPCLRARMKSCLWTKPGRIRGWLQTNISARHRRDRSACG